MPAVVSEQEFEQEVLMSELPVLVDFYADWCAPCKTVAPEVEALSHELEGKAKVVKVDIDKSPRLAQMLRIQSVPTFMVFHQGRPAAAERGALRRNQLRAMIEPFLPRSEGAIKAVELAQLLQAQRVVPVDTRDAGSFGRAHIPGAKHMALEEIETRLAELAMLPGVPVLYCRSGSQTKETVDKLIGDGIQAAFLEGGFLAWESEGLDIERP